MAYRKSLARWDVDVLHITKRVLGLHSLPAAFVRGPRVSWLFEGYLDRWHKCHPEVPLRIVCLARGAIPVPLFISRVLGLGFGGPLGVSMIVSVIVNLPIRTVCLARGANPVPLSIPRVLGLHLLPAACVRGPRKSLAV